MFAISLKPLSTCSLCALSTPPDPTPPHVETPLWISVLVSIDAEQMFGPCSHCCTAILRNLVIHRPTCCNQDASVLLMAMESLNNDIHNFDGVVPHAVQSAASQRRSGRTLLSHVSFVPCLPIGSSDVLLFPLTVLKCTSNQSQRTTFRFQRLDI